MSAAGNSEFGKQSQQTSYGQHSSQQSKTANMMPAADNKQKMYNQSLVSLTAVIVESPTIHVFELI